MRDASTHNKKTARHTKEMPAVLADSIVENPFGARTDVGCVREHNEDSFIAQAPLYAVADGMGGHAAGEVASEIAIQMLSEKAPGNYNPEALANAVAQANSAIQRASIKGIGKSGMGTTLTAALICGSRLLIAQVGDSRAYLLRNKELHQLTSDHSYVAELVAAGKITPEEAAVHPRRSIITRALGGDSATEPDLFTMHVKVGDRLLLCSDGLTGMVDDENITAVLTTTPDPQKAVDTLVEAARQAGGMDNITVIVVDIATIEGDVNPHEALDGALDKARAKREGGTSGAGGASGSGTGGAGGALGVSEITAGESSARSARGAHENMHARHASKTSQKKADRKRRGALLGIITFLVLFVLLVGGAIGGTYLYAKNVAFLRIDDGYVTVYRGLNGDVLPGIKLEWLERKTDIASSDLTPNIAQRLEKGISVASLDDAESLIIEYEELIEAKAQAAQSSASAEDTASNQAALSGQPKAQP
ncbi:MAG: Stp1/IreP family PP2C-type Ser/Thr phosphatase [Coriobacteriales bacterium]|jgi:serine/threonine protein phosphatase PrpC|nr:Stp1/IreP family PP2C-type Ser/Thr phosphatase [Coriobacteriales bacterium]